MVTQKKSENMVPGYRNIPSANIPFSASSGGYWRDQYFRIWSKYWKVACVFAIVLFVAGIAGSFYLMNQYSARAVLMMDQKKTANEWELLVDEARNLDFEEQIRSRAVLGPVLKKYRQEAKSMLPWLDAFFVRQESEDQKLAAEVESFQKSLEIKRPQKSNMLSITVFDQEPERAAGLANAIAQSYIDFRRDRTIQRTQNILAGIETELEKVQRELKSKIKERNDLLRSHGWDNYAVELSNSGQTVAGLKDAIRSLEIYRKNPEIKKSGAAMSQSGKLIEDKNLSEPSLLDVARKFAESDSQLSRVSSVHGGENWGVLQARVEKEMTEAMLKEKLRDPTYRYELIQKQLELEQQNLHELLSEEPRVQNLMTSISYLNQRQVELLEQRAKASFLLTQWGQQPRDMFDEIYVLEKALPPPARSWLLDAPLVLLTACLLSLMGLALLPIILSLWDAEFRPSAMVQPPIYSEPNDIPWTNSRNPEIEKSAAEIARIRNGSFE